MKRVKCKQKVYLRISFSALIAYILILFFFAVLIRDAREISSVKLDLFWGYNNPPKYIYRDNILNIASFVPIGLMTGMVFKRYRIIKALLVGMLVSLIIEFSQLFWHRGTFDVDDLFNNAVGALTGGLIVALMVKVRDFRKGL